MINNSFVQKTIYITQYEGWSRIDLPIWRAQNTTPWHILVCVWENTPPL